MKHGTMHDSKLRVNRRGTAAVLVVVAVPVLLGLAAITIDTGRLYGTRAELQNAADAAALAATEDLGGADPAASLIAARASAVQFIQLNPVWNDQPIVFDPQTDIVFGQAALDATGSSVQFFPNAMPATALRVTVHYDLQFTFAGIFGMGTRRVSASATASIGARDFMMVIDASGSMTSQSIPAEVAADLDALGIDYQGDPGNAKKTALNLTYDGSDPEFMGVFNIGDPFLPPSIRIRPMKAAKDAAAFAVQVVQDAGYDDLIGTASLAAGAPWAQELTTDYTRVWSKIRGLTKYGGSDLAAGILAAMNELLSIRSRNGADKVMVLFADGQSDSASALAAAQLAADSGITIHCVGLGTGVDQVLLGDIATIGGGKSYFVLDTSDPTVYEPQLQQIFQSLARDEVGIGLIQ